MIQRERERERERETDRQTDRGRQRQTEREIIEGMRILRCGKGIKSKIE